MQKQNLGKFKAVASLAIFGVMAMVGVFGASLSAKAANINASQVLGQIDGVTGLPSFTQSGSNSLSTDSHSFNYSGGLDIDTSGHRLFVADKSNNRVLVFNLANDNSLTDYNADFVLGQADFISSSTNRGGDPTSSTLNLPSDLVYDATNNRLFVSEYSNNRVLVFDVASITDGEPAVNVLGQADFSHNSPNRGSAAGVTIQDGLYTPTYLAYDNVNSRLFVSDYGNNRVLVFDIASITDGEPAVNVLGQADFIHNSANQGGDPTSTTLDTPTGVVLNRSANTLFVADGSNNRVLVFDVASVTDGEPAINVLGQADFIHNSTNGGRVGTGAGRISFASGLSLDETKKSLYIVDGSGSSAKVFIYDITSIENGEDAIAVFGKPDFNTWFSDPTGAATLNGTSYIKYSGTNNVVYVGDSSNHRVLLFKFVDLTSAVLPNGIDGRSYSQAVSAINSQGTVAYNVVSGTLPNGLSLDSISGIISGTPTSTGDFSFTIKVSNTFADGSTFSDSEAFSIKVLAFELPVTAFPNGVVGSVYNKIFSSAANAQGTVTYSLTNGNLPNGLVLDALNRTISGTPTVAGTFNFTITATDTVAVGVEYADAKAFTIIIDPAQGGNGGGGGGGGGGGNGGGGGGGGGGSPAFNAPAGGFSVAVRNVIAGTNPAQVSLALNGGTATRMAIASTPDFAGVGQEVYRTTTTHTLTAGNGVKTIYARFFDSFGTASIVVTTSVNITTTPNALPIIPEVLGVKITRLDELVAKLKAGQTSEEVKELQTELKKIGYFVKTYKPTKFYGNMTKAAVKKYLADKNKKPVVAKTLDELVALTKFGQKSELVKQLQTELKKLKFLPAKHVVTSYYGAITRTAVNKYVASQK